MIALFYLSGTLVFDVPGQVGQNKQGGDHRRHNGGAQSKIWGQDVQHGGGILGAGHEQIIGTGADDPVGNEGDGRKENDADIGLQEGFFVGPHVMHKDHIKNGDIANQVLRPKLIVAEPGGAGVGDHCGGDQGEDRAAKSPEIADIKEGLGFSDDHIACEDRHPAAHGDGKMVNRVGTQGGTGDQPPIIGHFADNQDESQDVADDLFIFHGLQMIAETTGQKDEPHSNQNRQKMSQGEIGEFHAFALAEEIT